MKKSFSKLPTFVLALSSATILLASVSCSSTRLMPVVQSNDTLHFTQKSASRDTIYLRDSVYVSERQRGDTVYLTRVEYRDRWRTRVERDTVVDVQVEKEVVQLPPERYVPKFYKWTAAIFWTGIALLILYLILRSYLHF